MRTPKNTRGFTIIEVVLVLAIAGLIFLIVFLALPAVQRSQRDTARKKNLEQILTLTVSYASNNNRNIPCYDATPVNCSANGTVVASWTAFKNGYLSGLSVSNPDNMTFDCGTGGICSYYLKTGVVTDSLSDYFLNSTSYKAGSMVYGIGGYCSGSSLNYGGTSAPLSRAAMWVKLENGGGYCKEV